MKNPILFTLLLFFNWAIAQLDGNNLDNFDFVDRLRAASSTNESSSYKNAEGSMYISDFQPIKISITGNRILQGRYNAFNGDMEIIVPNNEDPIILNKIKESYQVEFINQSKSYQNYVTSDNGVQKHQFFIKVQANEKITLLKKEVIKFVPGKSANNTYSVSKPDKFQRAKDLYYISLDSKTANSIKSKKDLIDLFPQKKKQISNFIKKNKLKLNSEKNLIQLVNFLDT